MGLILGFGLGNPIQELFVEPCPTDLDCWLYEWFTPAERLQLDRLPVSRRMNRITGHAAAKKSLSNVLGITPREITIDHYPSGTPFALVNDDNYPVSLTHMQGYGAALVSQQTNHFLGIDIVYDRGYEIADLMQRVSTPQEQNWLLSGEKRRRFFELWALKEAALKAWGVGMRIAPWEVEVTCPIQAESVTTIQCLSADLPDLCGTLLPGVEPFIIAISWSDCIVDHRSILQAYQQPRGLHLGC